MRCAIFVGAGYLLAAAGELCPGTRERSRIQCDYGGLLDAFLSCVSAHAAGEVLRLYWYDAAKDRIPSPDQQRIGALPYVKLRLGTISGGRQKGVDALIFRDMLTLSRERAIGGAYLLTGDEDLREAVVFCQAPDPSPVRCPRYGSGSAETKPEAVASGWAPPTS